MCVYIKEKIEVIWTKYSLSNVILLFYLLEDSDFLAKKEKKEGFWKLHNY